MESCRRRTGAGRILIASSRWRRGTPMNEFEKLCCLASTHHWCWKLPCTTCGNHHLRLGLTLIAHEVSLDTWDHSTTHWPDHIVPFGGGRIPLDTDTSARLCKVLSEASLSTIRRDAHKGYKGPCEDWLGYLGVALARSDFLPPDREALGKCWRVQLNRMIGCETASLESLGWEDLEDYERQLLCLSPQGA